MPYGSGYGSSKAAIMRFSETLAKEVEDQGITVFPMGPGLVRTEMTEYQLNTDRRKGPRCSSATILVKSPRTKIRYWRKISELYE